MKEMKWESPRGPTSIDPETCYIIQNEYNRKVEKKNGQLYNVEFATFEGGAAFFGGAGVMGGQTSLIVLAGTFYPTFIRATGVGWGLGIGRLGGASSARSPAVPCWPRCG